MRGVEVGGGAEQAWSLSRPRISAVHLGLWERRLIVGAGDIVALFIALSLALSLLALDSPGLAATPPIWWLTLVGLWLLMASPFDAYSSRGVAFPVPSALGAAQAGLATVVAYFLTPYISAPLLASRAVMLVFALGVLGFLVLWRTLATMALGRLVSPRLVLVLGAGGSARTVAEALVQSGDGYRLVGFVADDRDHDDSSDAEVLGGREDLGRLVGSSGVTDLVIAETSRMHADLLKVVVRAYESGVNVIPMAKLYEQLTGRIPVEHVGEDWIGALPQIERLGGLGGLAKRGFDIVGGLGGLLVLAALTPFIALAIRLDSPGPIFYSQERVGYRGRPFRMWKFRSMVERAEADGRARWSNAGDPRVTRVGRFLRVSGLDELTQVLNILRGEMSIVGPRPERPEFTQVLEGRIPFYRARLLVKPGLTGWAQIKFKYGSSADDSLVKLQYDLYYVKHRSLLLDALIIVKTVGVVLRGRRL